MEMILSRQTLSSDLMAGIIEDIEISHILPPKNTLRSSIEGIEGKEGLSYSIKQKGLLHPIIVRIKDSQNYEIVSGVRRYNACKSLGWRKISCHVVELSDKEAFEVSLIENVQRNELNVLDEGRAYKNYVDNFGWGSISHLAYKLGKSVSYVTKKIQLLELPSQVIDSIASDDLYPSIAEELHSIKCQEKQSELAEIIVKSKLSFRESRQLLNEHKMEDTGLESMKSTAHARIEKALRTLDRTIVVIRIAMNRIGTMIENSEDEVIFNALMTHKNLLHEQIDMLIKEKKKLGKRI